MSKLQGLLILRNPIHEFLSVLVERPCVPFFKKSRVSFPELHQKFCGRARKGRGHIFIVGCQKIGKRYLYLTFYHSFFVAFHDFYHTTLE